MIFAITKQSKLHAVYAIAAVSTVAIMLLLFDQSRWLPGYDQCQTLPVLNERKGAEIDLGAKYEQLGTSRDAQKAMSLYEQATRAEHVETVNRALMSILYLWKTNRATPSAEFARGATDVFDFLSKFDHKLQEPDHKVANFFVFWGCSPEPYNEYRWQLLREIRHSLGLSSASAAAPILVRGLKDSNEKVREKSRAALEDLGEGAVPELKRLLNDDSPEMRVESLKLMYRLGNDAEPAVSRMIELLVNDPDANVRQTARDSIRIDVAVPALAKLLKRSTASVRIDVASVLACMGPRSKAAVPALIELLQAPELEVRCAAAETLGCIGPDATAAVPILIQWLQYGRQNKQYQCAQRAICQNFKAAAVPALIQSLQSDASEVMRKESATCLCGIGPDAGAAIPALLELIRVEHSVVVCRYCVDALAFIGAHKPDGIAALQSALKDQRPDIQQQAAMRLREIADGVL